MWLSSSAINWISVLATLFRVLANPVTNNFCVIDGKLQKKDSVIHSYELIIRTKIANVSKTNVRRIFTFKITQSWVFNNAQNFSTKLHHIRAQTTWVSFNYADAIVILSSHINACDVYYCVQVLCDLLPIKVLGTRLQNFKGVNKIV